MTVVCDRYWCDIVVCDRYWCDSGFTQRCVIGGVIEKLLHNS